MIRLHHLTKRYANTLALDALSMEIPAGETLGFIGPNGAGKTTTLKILATLLLPTGGSAEIAGFDVRREPAQVRKLLGYMPDVCGVYDDMRVREYLAFFAAAYGLEGGKARSMIADVLDLTDLSAKADAPADTLSRGMAQRLQLARVLLHDPKVLLLDEPASGLDPRARIELRQLLKELRAMGKTLIVSSHILPELADLCSSIAILERGRLVYHGGVEEALRQTETLRTRRLRVAVVEREAEAVETLRLAGLADATAENGRIEFAAGEDWPPERIFDLLAGAGFRLRLLEDSRADLEDAFLHLTRGQVS